MLCVSASRQSPKERRLGEVGSESKELVGEELKVAKGGDDDRAWLV